MDDEQYEDPDISEIVSEIKGQLSNTAPPRGTDLETLAEEDLDAFVLNMSKTLAKEGLEAVQDVKDMLSQTPDDAESVAAFGSLLVAANRSLDILGKLMIQKKKQEGSKELKEMDAQRDEDSDIRKGLLMNREDLLKEMIAESKALEENNPIEAEIVIPSE
tara:strand:+ start:35061 stop:35543 length:483 start_codon:yes stop_codon:yes gene_type:complete